MNFPLIIPRQSRAFVPSPDGFTLVELLVGLAVAAVLVALALGASTRAIDSSRAAKSLANLRVIGTAIHGYAADNDGALPTMWKLGNPPWTRPFWVDLIKPYIGDRPYDLSKPADLNYRPEIFKCPLWKFNQYVSDYGNNYFLIAYTEGEGSWFWPYKAVRLVNIPAPSRTVMVAASGGGGGNSGTWLIRTDAFLASPDPKAPDQPAPVHNNKVHALFVDGRAAAIDYDEFVKNRHEYMGTKPFNRP